MLMRQAAADVGERQVVNKRANGVRKEGRKQRASIHALARPHTAIRSAAASASAAACEVKENRRTKSIMICGHERATQTSK